jgi:hypothetical protein
LRVYELLRQLFYVQIHYQNLANYLSHSALAFFMCTRDENGYYEKKV